MKLSKKYKLADINLIVLAIIMLAIIVYGAINYGVFV